MTLFKYGQKIFDENYKSLAKNVFIKKGKKDYDRCELLLISRLVGRFDLDVFADEINKYKWHFLRIWLGVYNETIKEWVFFEILPYPGYGSIGKITSSLVKLPY